MLGTLSGPCVLYFPHTLEKADTLRCAIPSGPKRLDRAPRTVRQIEAGPSRQLDVPAIYPCVHAVAAVLDLMQPATGRRRGVLTET